ncbi:hypothetical protein OIU34_37420 [Pararhizobium sp. BT-229]|uniref:hypothetical protein n=1 Tax=Pararhizobium sp. BT-229 TaxID=2986923 RepID=UPI0021F74E89|nr:hypothetical protein [Pararhizobium sp. BT-229]MCV9967508.1 hypothetical protein [Pararhizobium sp. BT-229]
MSLNDNFADSALMLLRLRRIRAEVNKGTPPVESLKILAQMISDQQLCDCGEVPLRREDEPTLEVRLGSSREPAEAVAFR